MSEIVEATPDQVSSLATRYERIAQQLAGLFIKNADPLARMATAAAVLHHKQPHFFWTGFYRMHDGLLQAAAYQGPLACSPLEPGRGVCWACWERNAGIIVPDVEDFPGHIPCDSRSRSEVVAPVRDASGDCVAVLDVDSTELSAFCEDDLRGLQRIAGMIYDS